MTSEGARKAWITRRAKAGGAQWQFVGTHAEPVRHRRKNAYGQFGNQRTVTVQHLVSGSGRVVGKRRLDALTGKVLAKR